MNVYGVKNDLQGATSCLWDVYRSPNSNRDNDVKINTTLQKANSSGYSHVLVCGDFNHPSLNWRDSTSPTDGNHPASLFMEAVRDSFLVQHVTEPTHYRGDNTPNTLDLIFTNESGMLDSLKYLAPIGKSHHSSLKMDFCCYTKASNTSKDRHIYDKGDYDRMREMMRSRDCMGDGTERQDRRRTVDHHDGNHQRRHQKTYPQTSQSREGHTKENEACMDERKGNSCSEEEDGSIHEIQTVQRGYRLHQLQKIGQQGEGRGEKGSPYLRENDRNGSEEEPQSVLQLREVEDEDEDRNQRPGISRRTHGAHRCRESRVA